MCIIITSLLPACLPAADQGRPVTPVTQTSRTAVPAASAVTPAELVTRAVVDANIRRSVEEGSEQRTIPPDFFGYNTGLEVILGDYWHQPDFLNAVSSLKPGNLRFPGGIVANYWDWERGWFTHWGESPFNQIADVKPIPNRLEDFSLAIEASGATPIFNLNLLSSDLESQIRMLQEAEKLGMTVRYIELGDQFYSNYADYVEKFPTGKDYGSMANRWIAALRKEFPGAKIAVDGSIEGDDRSGADDRLASWNQDLFQTLHEADAITLHIYPSNRAALGNGSRELPSAVIQLIIGTAFQTGGSVTESIFTDLPSGMQLWISEYNFYDPDISIQGTWLHGIFLAVQSLLFLDDQRIDLIVNSRLVGNADFGAIFLNEGGFQFGQSHELEGTPPPTTPLTPTASGSALTFVAEAIRDARIARKLEFSPELAQVDQGETSFPPLLGYSFTGDERKNAVLLNLSENSYPVEVGGLFPQEITIRHLSGDPLARISDPSLLTATEEENSSGNLTLPAYSITLLEGN